MTDYNIYRGQDGSIDYDTIVATMTDLDDDVEIAVQALGAGEIWHYVRRQLSECLLESDPSPACIVAIDGAGDMIPDRPNVPDSVALEVRAAGTLRARWRYSDLDQEIGPTGFRVYAAALGAALDFGTPAATVLYYQGGNRQFYTDLAGLTDGTRYRACVRAYATAGGETANINEVSAVARSSGPATLTYLNATQEAV